MVTNYVWIGITVAVFIAGIGVGYATIQNPTPGNMMQFSPQQMQQMMNDPDMMYQWHQTMMNNPQQMRQWMDLMINDPDAMTQMHNIMMDNPEHMNQMMQQMMNVPQMKQHMMGNMSSNMDGSMMGMNP